MVGPPCKQCRVPPVNLIRGPSVYYCASTYNCVRSQHDDLLTSISGTPTPAHRTGPEQFLHIKHHLNGAFGSPMLTSTGGDFLPPPQPLTSLATRPPYWCVSILFTSLYFTAFLWFLLWYFISNQSLLYFLCSILALLMSMCACVSVCVCLFWPCKLF